MSRGDKQKQPSCKECFFSVNALCALDRSEPCATFRINQQEGLKPPDQMRFSFREKTQTTWSFPAAEQQVAHYR